MLVEAFSEAKNPAAPETNEDNFVVLPGRAYAVLDGVTDRTGSRYDGMLSGRYASLLLQKALERLLTGPDAPLDAPLAIADAMTAEIAGAYRHLGVAEKVATDSRFHMASTIALVTLTEDTLHVLRVGDSGVRLNGTILLREEKDLDTITSRLRQVTWPVVASRVPDAAGRENVSRKVAFNGTRHAARVVAPVLTQDDLDTIEREAVALCRSLLPHVPDADILTMIQGGIIHSQAGYQNTTDSVLGYASMNGFPIPHSLIRTDSFPRSEIRTVELFSDGYFACDAGFGVAAWEARFAEVERDDPHKVTLFPSPKGSVAPFWADDRTYVAVRF
jgi:hypothetical protein